MAGDSMTLDAFEALMTDTEKTAGLRIIETAPGEDGAAAVVRETAYTAYTLPASVGKQRVDTVEHTTGAVTAETHLVAVLEQLTYIEQQLAALGIPV